MSAVFQGLSPYFLNISQPPSTCCIEYEFNWIARNIKKKNWLRISLYWRKNEIDHSKFFLMEYQYKLTDHPDICIAEGCGKKHHGYGYCRVHYYWNVVKKQTTPQTEEEKQIKETVSQVLDLHQGIKPKIKYSSEENK